MNNPDKNAKIVKGSISVVLRGRDLKFWERSEKNNILLRKNNAGLILELSQWSFLCNEY